MTTQTWGHCEHCRFFASPAKIPLGGEEARCMHPVLAKYQLHVFGASGCSNFDLRAGLSGRVELPKGTSLRRAPERGRKAEMHLSTMRATKRYARKAPRGSRARAT
jgi:hypothetical protein